MSSTPLQNYTKQLTPPIVPGDEKRCLNRETPDLLKINCKNFAQNQLVDTSITEAVVSRSDYCRFSLDRGRGILHSNSKIQLGITCPTALDDGFVYQPIGGGILSQIDRAVLRSGTTVIQEVRDASHYYTQKALLDTNEDVKNRYVITEGRTNAFETMTSITLGAGGVVGTATELPSQITVGNGLEPCQTYTPNPVANNNTVTQRNKLVREVQIANNSSEFVVSLATLFPCLTQFSLPLFMTEEVIIIELFFTTSADKKICYSGLAPAKTDVYSIDPTKTKLIADYINYSDEIMNEFREKNQTMALNFTDHQLVKSNNNYTTTANYTTSLGGSGKYVDDVLISHSELESVDRSDSLLNNYISNDVTDGAVATTQMAVNLRVNDRQLFPLDVNNLSEQYQNLLLAEGMPYNLTAEEYCSGSFGQSFYPHFEFESHALVVGLAGLKRYFGIRNSRVEERISNNGIDLIIRVTDPIALPATHVVRAYVGIRRSLVFRSGRFFVMDQ